MTKFEFIQNLKDNINYIKEHYPEHLDDYRTGVWDVSLRAVNECFEPIEINKTIFEQHVRGLT